MARLALVGPGAVGSYFAAHWIAAGHEVLLCSRRPFDRLVVESAAAPASVPARVVTDPTQVTAARPWVVVAVKAHQTNGILGWLDRLCGSGTRVVVLQNGVEARARVQPLVGDAEVLPGVVYCGAELLAPGHVVHSGGNRLLLPSTEAAREFVLFADGAATSVTARDDFTTQAWRKLGANVAVNGPTALIDRTTGVLRDPGVRALAVSLVRECWQVGAAAGADVDPDEAADHVTRLAEVPPVGTSMLQDRRAGRPTEHDALYGAVRRGGLHHGIPTPVTHAVQSLLRAGDPPAV